MKTKQRHMIPSRFIIPNIREIHQRRAYFQRKYLKLLYDAEWLYSEYCRLCNTYLVDEDNIASFNKKKKAIMLYAKQVILKLSDLEADIVWKGDLNLVTRKRKVKIVNLVKEITQMCGT